MSNFIKVYKKTTTNSGWDLLGVTATEEEGDSTPETFLKFFTGDNTILDISLERDEEQLSNLPLNDILLNIIADISDSEVSFVNESSLTNRVFIINPDNERRVFLTVIDSLGDEIKPDDDGYFYLKDIWSPDDGNIEFKIKIEIEPNFTSSYVQKSSLKDIYLSLNTSTQV